MKTYWYRKITVLMVGLAAHTLQAQDMRWYAPDTAHTSVIAGQLAPEKNGNRYERMPATIQNELRPAVWNLSKNAAGEYIEFYSSSKNIQVKYQVTGDLNMYHMATTGVSGLDLYIKGKNGEWFWTAGNANFKDTITYNFKDLDTQRGNRFRLYLPLYNTVKNLKIGVDQSANFEVIPQHRELPIVIYGTSIAQGACASRAGMAWSNILGRNLDLDIVNLGFSGNGKLEKPLIDFIIQQPSKLIVLDCIPNLSGSNFSKSDVFGLITTAVKQIRAKYNTPILLVQHSSGFDSVYNLNTLRDAEYAQVSKVLDSAYQYLRQQKTTELYELRAQDFHFDNQSTVDGLHPNDVGMQKIAAAYTQKIREILHLPTGDIVTNQPIQQFREYPGYDWLNRHYEVMAYTQKYQPKLVILGNSIMHWWAGNPVTSRAPRAQKAWDKYVAPFAPVNMGFGWDRIENMLWRLQNGELDHFTADKIYIMAGTNNLTIGESDAEILTGISALIAELKFRQPKAKILLSGIFPRRAFESRVQILNVKIHNLAQKEGVNFADFSAVFLQKDGKIDEKLFSDGLHPNEVGYTLFAEKLASALKGMK